MSKDICSLRWYYSFSVFYKNILALNLKLFTGLLPLEVNYPVSADLNEQDEDNVLKIGWSLLQIDLTETVVALASSQFAFS